MKRLSIIMAVLIIANLVAGLPAKADAINSNSIEILLSMEFYLQTDKAVYNPGETIEMLYRVTNIGVGDIMFYFNTMRQAEFWASASDGSLVWDMSGYVVFPALSNFALHPGEYKEYTMDWQLIHDNGTPDNPLDDYPMFPGSYDITAVLCGYETFTIPGYGDTDYVYDASVSVPITVVPEPATTALLSLGLLGVLIRRRR